MSHSAPSQQSRLCDGASAHPTFPKAHQQVLSRMVVSVQKRTSRCRTFALDFAGSSGSANPDYGVPSMAPLGLLKSRVASVRHCFGRIDLEIKIGRLAVLCLDNCLDNVTTRLNANIRFKSSHFIISLSECPDSGRWVLTSKASTHSATSCFNLGI